VLFLVAFASSAAGLIVGFGKVLDAGFGGVFMVLEESLVVDTFAFMLLTLLRILCVFVEATLSLLAVMDCFIVPLPFWPIWVVLLLLL